MEKIVTSKIHSDLKNRVAKNLPLNADDAMWDDIKKAVMEISPDFIVNLRLLTQGRLSNVELQTALLLKCGMLPSDLKVLFTKSNGAIVSRRETLSVKIFDRKIGVTIIDRIIRLL